MNPKKPVWLFDDVTAGSTVTKEYTFKNDSTITGLWARNYIGHGFDLRYYYQVQDEEGKTKNLLTHLGKEFITGDDDTHDINLRVPVKEDEKLIVKVENNTTDYLYHANTYVEIDQEGNTVDNLASKLANYVGVE